ncbi:MAG TPA: flagellar protein FlaG [Candidatus Sulfopaludibacter sp.]|jgi:flagellar protein FlaG|nr:flagellar protein FlaG [Candidatus Sulfopaludibacter sp.]
MDFSGVNRSGPAAPATAPTLPAESKAENREVIQAVKALNATEMFGERNELQFQKDPETRRMVIRMVDRQTKEVMAQIPPEYVIQLAAQVKSSQTTPETY